MSPLLWLAGCGPDLAKLETKERALEQEVAILRGNVGEMRVRMEEMGLLHGGPAPSTGQEADHDLSKEIPVAVKRTGEPTELPALPAPERRPTTDCGYRFAASWLEPLSDTVLEQSGAGRSSPILLKHDGVVLTPHAPPMAYEKSCKHAFRHSPKYLFFTPDGAVDAVGGSWALGLAEPVPLPRGGDGRPMFWVYPGTTLTFELGTAWDAEKWGPLEVTLDARVIHVGTPDAPSPKPGSPVTVSFLGFEQSGKERVFGLHHTPEPPDGPWTIDIASPPSGPFVLVETLVAGNATNAVILTSPEAEE